MNLKGQVLGANLMCKSKLLVVNKNFEKGLFFYTSKEKSAYLDTLRKNFSFYGMLIRPKVL